MEESVGNRFGSSWRLSCERVPPDVRALGGGALGLVRAGVAAGAGAGLGREVAPGGVALVVELPPGTGAE